MTDLFTISLTHPSRIPHAIRKTGVLDAILFHAMERSVSRGGTKCFIPWNKVFQRLKQLKPLSYRFETNHNIDLQAYVYAYVCVLACIRARAYSHAYALARLCACTHMPCVYVYYKE